MMQNIVVIGAGVIGLSTAVCIQKEIPNCQVTIIAESFEKDTTSYGAAGAYRINSSDFPKNCQRTMDKICADSFFHLWNLAVGDQGPVAGVHLIPIYQTHEESEPEIPTFKKFVAGFRVVEDKELRALGFPTNIRSGFFYLTPLAECRIYLSYLSKKFCQNGGRLQQRKLMDPDDVRELGQEYQMVVNCSGLGSRELFLDKKVYPVRGQVMRVKAPWQKFSIHSVPSTYMYTVRDSLVVGGVRQSDDWDLTVRSADREDILARTRAFLPGLKHADILEEWVGLRPKRESIRIEIEVLPTDKGSLPVVHNYGHGPHGVGLSWGSAVEATRLVKQIVDQAPPKSRL